jgi:alpha,alpha-trehalose phosphorylase
VTVQPQRATYELLDGDPITIRHHGDEVELGGEPVSRPIPPAPRPPRPQQPPGRAPDARVIAPEHAATG